MRPGMNGVKVKKGQKTIGFSSFRQWVVVANIWVFGVGVFRNQLIPWRLPAISSGIERVTRDQRIADSAKINAPIVPLFGES
jgi:hypothetical protein